MRGLLVSITGAIGAAALLGSSAVAQQPPAMVQVVGPVQSLDGTTLVVDQNGQPNTVTMPATVMVSTIKPISVADIKPGSFIGTTNVDRPDGSGTSTEVHVFPPGVKMGEGHYSMGQGDNMMTNGSVTAMVTGTAGEEMDIKYDACPPAAADCTPGGTRHVVVPPGTPVIAIESVDRAELKPGVNVMVIANKDAAGALTAIAVNLTPPPPAK
jgi:hypothetical protein